MDQLQESRAQYSVFWDDEAAYDHYISEMQKAGVWGDEVALKAICDNLDIGV